MGRPGLQGAPARRRHGGHRRARLRRAPRASTWWSWRTRPRSTTSSSARCARATRGRCSACRPAGTRAPPTAPASVREPRAVLAEFGTVLPDEVEVRVWDSSAELRYLVLPVRPAGTDDLHRGGARRPRHPRPHDRRGPLTTHGGPARRLADRWAGSRRQDVAKSPNAELRRKGQAARASRRGTIVDSAGTRMAISSPSWSSR